MSKVNIFQISKVQPHGVAQFFLTFSQFQHSGAYKIVAYKKGCSLLIHTDNHKNSFLVLGKASNDDVNHSVGTVEKKSSAKFTKATRNYIICM